MAASCQQVAEWIEQALEGSLPPRQERELQRHLESCAHCRQRYQREELAMKALRLLPSQEPPADLNERIMAALPQVSPRLLGRLAGVLHQAGQDPNLRRRLREQTQATLLSLHIALPPGLRIEIVSQQPAPLPTPEVLYLPLPETPLEFEELEQRLAAMGLGALFGFWW